MVDADELAYLDQLHEKAMANVGENFEAAAERDRAKRRFIDIVFQLWPDISKTFDDDKHSL